ncbi:hypothetical protein [Paraburkholderia dipogonis]|uniref:hypothetical protein n=1 Tax=Paraburkholderia dipogonis TaxID=1211383 RepID=UPI0038B8BF1B
MAKKQILLNAFSMHGVGRINHGLWDASARPFERLRLLRNRGQYKTAYADGTLRHKLSGEDDQLPARHAAAAFRRHTAKVI